MSDPMVTVLCITYNHIDFVEDAINGFLRQKTNFPFEILIHDDCSDDGTDQILREYEKKYPERIQLITEEENQYSKGINIPYDIMLPRIRGKYIAVCEGDDYWTDDNKLQKQFDFMEAHHDYSLCCHNGVRHNYYTGETIIVNPFDKTGTLSEEQVFFSYGKNAPTASYFIRKKILDSFPEEFARAPIVDDVIKLYSLSQGKIWYDDQPMCYREYLHPNSWNNKMSESIDLVHYYTYGILDFYYKFDMFTTRRFHRIIEIIEKKYIRRLISLYEECGKSEDFLTRIEKEMDTILLGNSEVLDYTKTTRKELFDELWRSKIS